ncbi:hypothetical protein [Shewanella gaetbuli]
MDKFIKPKNSDEYFNSKDTMKMLKVTSCELMHLRVTNKIQFYKRGNAYFYQVNSLQHTTSLD